MEATRDVRRQMEANGELEENRPIRSSTISWGGHEDWEMEQLRRDGVDMDGGPNRTVLDASNALNAAYKATSSASKAAELAVLWSKTLAVLALVDANPDLHGDVDRSAWGHVANVAERLASSPNFHPGNDGLPDLDSLFAVLRRLSSSPYPLSREDSE